MGNKLSELSKPAWIVGEKEIADFMSGDEALLVRGNDPESTEPALRMYSQEYVSALLAELEAKDKALNNVTELWKDANATAFERIRELKAKLATPIKIVDYDEFFICHVSGASDDYCKGWVDGRNAAARDVGKAGFTVEGDE